MAMRHKSGGHAGGSDEAAAGPKSIEDIVAEDLAVGIEPEDDAVKEIDRAAKRLTRVRREIGKVIFGQDLVVEEVLITLLAEGHGLLVGVPGLAKTLLVETLGRVLGLSQKRVQFTPDLLPADILGSEVLEEEPDGRRSFRFIKGPVFCQLLMADEINRASPRTQSALLQAMQERKVTIAGETYTLPDPFHVLATQNPIEHEGTYPLPEAQLDRFFMQIRVDYPDEESEREILLNTTGIEGALPETILTGVELKSLQRLVREIPVGEKTVEAILKLVRGARPGAENTEEIVWGPGPRAAQALMLGVKARALLEGRYSPSVDDVAAIAIPVLRHRMALSFAARAEGQTVDDFIGERAGEL